jgi:hypothetical protein
MSRIFNPFTITTDNDPSRVIEQVLNRDLSSVRSYLGSLSTVRDFQKNNLLHLATLNEDAEMVKFLLTQYVDRNGLNRFCQTPWDYAIKSHNKNIIKLYTDQDSLYNQTLTVENNGLKKTVTDLTIKNNVLAYNNDTHTKEITILKSNNKRLRDENDNYKIENENLLQSNKKLKTSVDSLTKALKK